MLYKLLGLWTALFFDRVSIVQTCGQCHWTTYQLWLWFGSSVSFCRYCVIPKTKKCLEDIDKFIKENHFDDCGIIYCLSRMDCEKVAEKLQVFFWIICYDLLEILSWENQIFSDLLTLLFFFLLFDYFVYSHQLLLSKIKSHICIFIAFIWVPMLLEYHCLELCFSFKIHKPVILQQWNFGVWITSSKCKLHFQSNPCNILF